MYEEETRRVNDVGDKEMSNQLLQQGESGAAKFKQAGMEHRNKMYEIMFDT